MKKINLFAIIVFATILSSCSFSKNDKVEIASGNDTTVTQLQIINATDSSVTVWITLGAVEGCLQNVSTIPYVTDSIGNLVGSFVLAAHDTTVAYAPDSVGFNGNITFGTQPLNCATVEFPNGVNIFEFMLNNSFQAGNPQETVDISCVAGVNSYIRAFLTGSSWNASPLYPDVDTIYNGTISGNSGLVGVYPYSCDTCMGSKNPPSCVTPSSDKQIAPICNVQRNASNSGGLVTVIYEGNKLNILK